MAVFSLFARLRIGTRIYAGFIVMLVLVAALGGIGVLNLENTQDSFLTFTRVSNNALKVAETTTDFVTLRRTIYAYGTASTDNPQTLAASRDGIARFRDAVATTARGLQSERRALLEDVGRSLQTYAANFDKLVDERTKREKDFEVLLKTGAGTAETVDKIVKGTAADSDLEAAVFAGHVEESFLLGRINVARFLATPDQAMVDGFKQNFQTFRVGLLQLAERVKNSDVKRLVADATTSSAAYAQAFDGFSAKSLAINELLNTTMVQQGAAMQTALSDLVAKQHTALTGVNRQMIEGMKATSTTMIAIAVGTFVFGMVIAYVIGRGITRPVSGLTAGMKELASGNFAVALPGLDRKDEVGEMAQAVESFKVKAAEKARLEAEERQAEDARKAEEKRLADEREAARQRAADETAATDRKAAMHALADQFERAVGDVVSKVSTTATELETAATTLTSTADSTRQLAGVVASASEEASANVQSVASAANEMSASVDEISRQVQESSRIAGEAVNQARSTDERITSLSQAAQRIGDVVKLITAVAEQTNLLALNATIEAARAGEAGKGFAVVAQEVKALAAQTAKATDEIASQIAGMQSETSHAVTAIKEIGGTIGRISQIAATIASAVEEQGASTAEISRNVQQAAQGTAQVASTIVSVNQGAGETGSASSQVLSSAQHLAGESSRLKLEVDKFLATVRAA